MTFETGGNFGLSQLEESTFGTPPGAGDMLPIRKTGGVSLELTKEILESEELRQDQQRAVVRHGNRTVAGDIPFELSNQDFDIGIQAIAGGTWTKAIDLTLTDIDVDEPSKVFTSVAQNFETAGVEVGDRITFSGFTNGGNNSTFTVSAVSGLTMTFATATGLVTEAAGDTVDIDSDRYYVLAGTLLRTFAMQKYFAGLAGNKYEHFAGCAYNGMTMTVAPNAITNGSFSMIGQNKTTDNAAGIRPSTLAASTNQPFDSYTGTISSGGSAIGVATSAEITMSRGLEPAFVIGSDEAARLLPARYTVDITMDAYLEDFAFVTGFLDEVETTFILQMGFGTEFLRVTCPRIKPTEAAITVPSEQGVVQNLGFQALLDSTTNTNIRFDVSSLNSVGI